MLREYTYTVIERPRWNSDDGRPSRDPEDKSPRKPWDNEDWGDKALRWNGVYRPGEAVAQQAKQKVAPMHRAAAAAAQAGVAKAGRLCSGNVTAESEADARAQIAEKHGDNCELVNFEARTVLLTL